MKKETGEDSQTGDFTRQPTGPGAPPLLCCELTSLQKGVHVWCDSAGCVQILSEI